MGRHSCCYKQKLRKGLWSPEEDEKLLRHITKYGHGCWSSVPKQAGLQRCGKSCRLRWINYLRPDLKRGTFSQQEENLIVELHAKLGNRWSQIAAQLPGRTDNEIKNLWNSSLKKRLRQSGIDPSTHKPLSEVDGIDADNTNNNKSTSSANDKPTAAAVSPTSLNSAAAEPSPTARVANPPVGVVPRMKELSLDRCREVMDPIDMEYFPGNYATTAATSSIGGGGLNAISSSTNSLMWFNQTAADFSISSVLPAAASSVLSIPMRLKQMAATGLLMDVGMPQNYWETGAASSNNSSCTTGTSASSIGLQTAVAGTSAGSLFDAAGAGFAWPELGQPDKDGAFHLDGREAEVFKWSEFIQTASAAGTGFPNSGTMISQQGVNTNSLFEDTKCGAGGGDTQFVIDELSAWQQSLEQQQHQHQPQLPDLYGKDFQRISAAFGQM